MSEVADSFNKETLIWEKEPLLYRIAYYLCYSLLLTLSETGVSPTALSTPCISYTVIKFSLIGLAGWDLFYSYKMTFLRKRGVIFRELVTHTQKVIYLHFIEILLHTSQQKSYVNTKLICETYDVIFMTSLLTSWRVHTT